MNEAQRRSAILLLDSGRLTPDQEVYFRELLGGRLMFSEHSRLALLQVGEIASAASFDELAGYLAMQAAWIKVRMKKDITHTQ